MTRRFTLAIAILALAAAFIAGLVAVKRATAAEPERCQIWIKPIGEDWRPYSTKGRQVWTFTSCTACSTDIGGQSKLLPDGTAMACVDARKLVAR